MKVILDIATLLGGIAALVFFWQQLAIIRTKRTASQRGEYRPPPKNTPSTQASHTSGSKDSEAESSLTLRQRVMSDFLDDQLRARYLESRSQEARTNDEYRAVGMRIAFGIGFGLAIWLSFYSVILMADWFLMGIRTDVAAIIVWTIAGAVSGVVCGALRECVDIPPHFNRKAIVKEIKDFWLVALIWFMGVGVLGYLTGFIVMNWPESKTVRLVFLIVWVVGYVGASLITYGPKGSVYRYGNDIEHMAQPGPLPPTMYLFCKYGLTLYDFGGRYSVSKCIPRVRDSIKATLLILCLELVLIAMLTSLILKLLRLISLAIV